MTRRITTERGEALQPQELPPLSTLDRLALATGTRLILWAEQHRRSGAARAAAAEHARAVHEAADQAALRSFERRTWTGHR